MKVMEANTIRTNKNWLLVNLSPLLISAAIFISGYISKLHSNGERNGNIIESKDSEFHKNGLESFPGTFSVNCSKRDCY